MQKYNKRLTEEIKRGIQKILLVTAGFTASVIIFVMAITSAGGERRITEGVELDSPYGASIAQAMAYQEQFYEPEGNIPGFVPQNILDDGTCTITAKYAFEREGVHGIKFHLENKIESPILVEISLISEDGLYTDGGLAINIAPNFKCYTEMELPGNFSGKNMSFTLTVYEKTGMTDDEGYAIKQLLSQQLCNINIYPGESTQNNTSGTETQDYTYLPDASDVQLLDDGSVKLWATGLTDNGDGSYTITLTAQNCCDKEVEIYSRYVNVNDLSTDTGFYIHTYPGLYHTAEMTVSEGLNIDAIGRGQGNIIEIGFAAESSAFYFERSVELTL